MVSIAAAAALLTIAGNGRGAVAAALARSPLDERALRIAREVEKIRGLRFEHPVAVEYLGDAAFDRKVTVDQDSLSKSDKAAVARDETRLRAIGLLGPDVDLVGALSDLRQSGVLAFYDLKTKRVVVRGRMLDVPTRVTLAHELTHALDDQHFDLSRVKRAAGRSGDDAARALIEGDAVRVQREYVATLSAEDRAAYTATQGTGYREFQRQLERAHVPEILATVFQTPYSLGSEMVGYIQAAKGDAAVDHLFDVPRRDDRAFLDPTSLLEHSTRVHVDTPQLGFGEHKVGKPDTFGAFVLLLVLSTAMDPTRALETALDWRGDSMVTFERDGQTCVRARFAGANDASTMQIGTALEQWAAGRSSAAVDRSTATMTACDDGSSTGAGPATMTALLTATLRNELLSQIAAVASTRVAGCVADRAVADPSFAAVRDASAADPSVLPDDATLAPFQRRVLDLVGECGRPS